VPCMKSKIGMWTYVLVLTIASAFVVVDGAAAEPYILFRYSDAFVQIGIAVALIVLWLQFSVWLSYAAITRRVPKPWLALIIWAGITCGTVLWHMLRTLQSLLFRSSECCDFREPIACIPNLK